jgi:hypothetical protein
LPTHLYDGSSAREHTCAPWQLRDGLLPERKFFKAEHLIKATLPSSSNLMPNYDR